jgi:uncharacterized membrane protein YhaH (DUF805 family)
MGFFQAIQRGFSGFFVVSGRSIRSEYWYFSVLNYLIHFALFLIEGKDPEHPISWLIMLVMCIPWINVCTRRFHDINKSGWWQLIIFTIVGLIPFFYWMCKKGDNSSNNYGTNYFNKEQEESKIWSENKQNNFSENINDIEDQDVEDELLKIENMFERKVISKKEKDLMRKKVLKI